MLITNSIINIKECLELSQGKRNIPQLICSSKKWGSVRIPPVNTHF